MSEAAHWTDETDREADTLFDSLGIQDALTRAMFRKTEGDWS